MSTVFKFSQNSGNTIVFKIFEDIFSSEEILEIDPETSRANSSSIEEFLNLLREGEENPTSAKMMKVIEHFKEEDGSARKEVYDGFSIMSHYMEHCFPDGGESLVEQLPFEEPCFTKPVFNLDR